MQPDVMDAFNTEAMKLGARGVTVTVSSGDNGVSEQQCNRPSGSANSNWTVSTYISMHSSFPN